MRPFLESHWFLCGILKKMAKRKEDCSPHCTVNREMEIYLIVQYKNDWVWLGWEINHFYHIFSWDHMSEASTLVTCLLESTAAAYTQEEKFCSSLQMKPYSKLQSDSHTAQHRQHQAITQHKHHLHSPSLIHILGLKLLYRSDSSRVPLSPPWNYTATVFASLAHFLNIS